MQSLIVLSCLVLLTLVSTGRATLSYQSYQNLGLSTGYYQGPLAPLAQDGQVLDTPEVAQAKQAHLAAFAAESAKTAHLRNSLSSYPADDSQYQNVYRGPPAPLGPHGQVVDTPEVAHAKAAHLAAHAEQLAKIAYHSNVNSYSPSKW